MAPSLQMTGPSRRMAQSPGGARQCAGERTWRRQVTDGRNPAQEAGKRMAVSFGLKGGPVSRCYSRNKIGTDLLIRPRTAFRPFGNPQVAFYCAILGSRFMGSSCISGHVRCQYSIIP